MLLKLNKIFLNCDTISYGLRITHELSYNKGKGASFREQLSIENVKISKRALFRVQLSIEKSNKSE